MISFIQRSRIYESQAICHGKSMRHFKTATIKIVAGLVSMHHLYSIGIAKGNRSATSGGCALPKSHGCDGCIVQDRVITSAIAAGWIFKQNTRIHPAVRCSFSIIFSRAVRRTMPIFRGWIGNHDLRLRGLAKTIQNLWPLIETIFK